MTRIPGAVLGPGRRPMPDVYSVLLLIGTLFLLVASIFVVHDLMVNYQLSFGELFSGVKLQ